MGIKFRIKRKKDRESNMNLNMEKYTLRSKQYEKKNNKNIDYNFNPE